jgi:hypothetical protein
MSWFRNACTLVVAAGVLVVAAAARAAEADNYLPADTKAVLVVNVRQTLDAPLVKKHALEHIKEGLKQNDQLQKALTAAGVDPLKDVSSVIVATTGAPTKPENALVIVHGTFDVEKAQTAAEDFAKNNPDKLKIEKQDGIVLYESNTGQSAKPSYSAFADKNTAVMSLSKDAVVTAAKGGGKPATLDKDLTGLLAKADTKQTIWMAALAPSDLKKMLAQGDNTKEFADKIDGFTGAVGIDKDVQAAFHIFTADEKAADGIAELLDNVKGLAKVFAQQNPKVGGLLGDLTDNIKITTEKSRVDITLKVDEDMIQKGLKQLPKTPPGKEPKQP